MWRIIEDARAGRVVVLVSHDMGEVEVLATLPELQALKEPRATTTTAPAIARTTIRPCTWPSLPRHGPTPLALPVDPMRRPL